MLEMLAMYWEMGYHFVEGSYYGDHDVEEWEDVVETVEEVDEEEWLTLEVEVQETEHVVYLFVQDEE